MKRFLTLITVGIFLSISAQGSVNTDGVADRVRVALSEVESMSNNNLAGKKIIMMNVLTALANSNIGDYNPDLVDRAKLQIVNLDQSFTKSERRLIERDLSKLDK